MKNQDYIRHVATPVRILLTGLIILIAVTVVQGLIFEIARELTRPPRRSTAAEPKKPLIIIK